MKVSKSQLIEEIRQRHITSCSVYNGFVREINSLDPKAEFSLEGFDLEVDLPDKKKLAKLSKQELHAQLEQSNHNFDLMCRHFETILKNARGAKNDSEYWKGAAAFLFCILAVLALISFGPSW